MPARRLLTMRQIRRALRLHHDGAATRDIGRVLGVARSTVQDALKRAAAANLPWPLPEDLTDEALEARLFARTGVVSGARRRPEPDWGLLVRELKRPGVNMMILCVTAPHRPIKPPLTGPPIRQTATVGRARWRSGSQTTPLLIGPLVRTAFAKSAPHESRILALHNQSQQQVLAVVSGLADEVLRRSPAQRAVAWLNFRRRRRRI